MHKPDYTGGGLINLVASIESALGKTPKYQPLRHLDLSGLKGSRNIVLMIMDGLGYDFVMGYGKGTVLHEHLKGKMTSVFPSSTSAAIPTIFTGLSPQEHGMTGWFMYLREFDCQVIPLPYVLRSDKTRSLEKLKAIQEMFNIKPLADRLAIEPYVLQWSKILNSGFSVVSSGKSERIGYKSLRGYFEAIKRVIGSHKRRKFICAYYPRHDSLCHRYGSTSKKVLDHFRELAQRLSSFLDSLEGTNTIVIITADHGMIDVYPSTRIDMEDHPKLKRMLAQPLCGEHRFAYAYIKPSKEKDFERYVRTKLTQCCEIFRSDDLLKKGYFGRFNIHKEMRNRIGDYVLIMKDHYGIYDRLAHEKKNDYNLGDHGGLSKEELYVPLIVVKR